MFSFYDDRTGYCRLKRWKKKKKGQYIMCIRRSRRKGWVPNIHYNRFIYTYIEFPKSLTLRGAITKTAVYQPPPTSLADNVNNKKIIIKTLWKHTALKKLSERPNTHYHYYYFGILFCCVPIINMRLNEGTRAFDFQPIGLKWLLLVPEENDVYEQRFHCCRRWR